MMEYWKLAYGWGWCTIDQLKQVVFYKEITEENFEEITGQPYEVPKE